jgi:hypothetical protein
MAAAVTLDPQEPVFKPPALEVFLELLADEVRKVASSAFDHLNEVRVMFSDNGIKCGLFGTMSAVGRWSYECGC